ncbi:MAG: hypothetical protein IPJ19_10835 [Planctomycetes bacterium]|nr:hypothetical protein [Planctomycetota bacterium]
MRRSRSRLIPQALGLLLAAACGGAQLGEVHTLTLVRMDPGIREGVFLNEALTFHFDAEVDPLSVGRDTLSIQTRAGERAHGSLRVEGQRVVFRPDVPHAADLSDGGYRPGAEYIVTLAGFPRPDGLRGSDGAPLARTQHLRFTTVALDSPRRNRIFDDPYQEHSKPPDLFPGGPGDYQVSAGDPIYLACGKQLDPTSIHARDFVLVPKHSGTGAQELTCFARLLENDPAAQRAAPRGVRSLYGDSAWSAERRAALIELAPEQTLKEGDYTLWYRPAAPPAGEESWSLRDFSLRSSFPPGPQQFPHTIHVFPAGSSETNVGELLEDFDDKDLSTPLVVPGCDGTATWDGTGRVVVHYPLAAGDGSAGAVSLGEVEPRSDLQATSVDLAADVTCSLGDAPGLVVLRAQGRITLAGRLERRTPYAEALDCDAQRGEQLSGWLARAQAANPSWIVLIAGGDIVLSGELRSSVPVLLVAGGQIRDAGLYSAPKDGLWSQSGAGGIRASNGPRPARFYLDPPVGLNPLRRELRYAVVSGPLPQSGQVMRWISAASSGGFEPPVDARRPVSSDHTSSSYTVRYFPADAPQAPDFSKGVTNPAFLPQPGAVRFVVELVVGDDKDFLAPYVDRVQLSYEQPPR